MQWKCLLGLFESTRLAGSGSQCPSLETEAELKTTTNNPNLPQLKTEKRFCTFALIWYTVTLLPFCDKNVNVFLISLQLCTRQHILCKRFVWILLSKNKAFCDNSSGGPKLARTGPPRTALSFGRQIVHGEVLDSFASCATWRMSNLSPLERSSVDGPWRQCHFVFLFLLPNNQSAPRKTKQVLSPVHAHN